MSETHHGEISLSQEEISVGALAPRLMRGGFAIALASLSALLVVSRGAGAARVAHAWLVGVTYFLTIALGALFFVMLQHLTRAGWSTVVRRVAEHIAATAPYVAMLLAPLVWMAWTGSSELYPWVRIPAGHDLLASKRAFLNVPFFMIRFGIYLAVWAFLSQFYRNHSIAQDSDKSLRHNYTLQWVAAPGIAAFALSITFFAVDFLMALDPLFFSTIFGVYVFAGAFMSFFCTLALFTMFLQRRGLLAHIVTREHFHDIGKFTFGFVFFWGYVAFSQFMLIWYGNIPEETVWFGRRMEGAWLWISAALLVTHLLLPFPGLLSRHVKRHRIGLSLWASLLLVSHYIDIYWLAMPPPHGAHEPVFGLIEILSWFTPAGIFFGMLGRHLGQSQLVPVGDPRLNESLAFENQ